MTSRRAGSRSHAPLASLRSIASLRPFRLWGERGWPEVWAGDVLRFADCELQVRLPREPCGKLNIAMGYSGAVRAMAQSGFCGFYLSVLTPGSLQAGEAFTLLPGKRGTGIPQLFAAKMFKHLRGT